MTGVSGAISFAGAVGAGGLGDLAIRYGYQRFETSVMIAVTVVLIAPRRPFRPPAIFWHGLSTTAEMSASLTVIEATKQLQVLWLGISGS